MSANREIVPAPKNVAPVETTRQGDACPRDPNSASRREFLTIAGGLASAAIASNAVHAMPPAPPAPPIGDVPPPPGCELGPLNGVQRMRKSISVRSTAAGLQKFVPIPPHPCNGDEALYPNRIGNYSKGLPHDALGEVNPAAYDSLLDALADGSPPMFEAITMGSPPALRRRLVNPQSGLAFDLEGTDSHQFAIPPAPTFSSAEEAGEIVENYWMALTRDVPFADYATHPLALAACADLSALSDFRGPKQGGLVTPQTLFRDSPPGVLDGPYISQFLWLPAPFGANFIEQRMRTHLAGVNFMTSYADWLSVQNGIVPSASESFEAVRRHIINGRDMGQWVHVDVLFQAYFHALLILLTPPSATPNAGGIGAPPNAGNPYNLSATQDGFGTFGGPHYATVVCEVATRALKAIWFQKWFVHRRLRPEAFAGRIHNHVTGAASYPIHADALNSAALGQVFSQYGTYLLPMEFPEGSPLHPAYGAGHATVAGACVTILKALFDENYVIPNPVVPDPADPTQLIPYVGSPLTVGGELNKLAVNIAFGRNIAGVHWRTDGTESMRLGEQVAIALLKDQRGCFNETFSGFTFTKFDGTQLTV